MKNILKRRSLKNLLCIAVFVAAAISVPIGSAIVNTATGIVLSPEKKIIIIDPGHGGFDGGAESAGGVCEKDINLAISRELRRLLEENGYRVVMTRDSDISLGESSNGTIRSKKTADLAERKKIIDKEEPLLTVSIHLNSFKEDGSVRGAQVFYPNDGDDEEVLEQSRELAEFIQDAITSGINDGTNRAALGKSGVRILKNPYTPIAIVECGFLSNYEEAELLQNEEYQQKIADCVYKGIMQFINCG